MLGSLGFAGFNLLSYVGLEHTHPQNAALIVALQPLVTALGLWLTTRQVPTRHTFAAMAVALLGVFLVITKGHPSTIAHGDGALGELLVLIGCACWIVYTLGARRFPDFSPLRYTAISATYGTLTIFAVTAIVALTGGHALRRRRRACGGRRSTSSSSARWSPCSPGTRACAASAPPTARSSSTSCRSSASPSRSRSRAMTPTAGSWPAPR